MEIEHSLPNCEKVNKWLPELRDKMEAAWLIVALLAGPVEVNNSFV